MNKKVIEQGASRNIQKAPLIRLLSMRILWLRLLSILLPKKRLFVVGGGLLFVVGLWAMQSSDHRSKSQSSEIPLIIDAYPAPNVNNTSNAVLSVDNLEREKTDQPTTDCLQERIMTTYQFLKTVLAPYIT